MDGDGDGRGRKLPKRCKDKLNKCVIWKRSECTYSYFDSGTGFILLARIIMGDEGKHFI